MPKYSSTTTFTKLPVDPGTALEALHGANIVAKIIKCQGCGIVTVLIGLIDEVDLGYESPALNGESTS
jgi:hypothetical protein